MFKSMCVCIVMMLFSACLLVAGFLGGYAMNDQGMGQVQMPVPMASAPTFVPGGPVPVQATPSPVPSSDNGVKLAALAEPPSAPRPSTPPLMPSPEPVAPQESGPVFTFTKHPPIDMPAAAPTIPLVPECKPVEPPPPVVRTPDQAEPAPSMPNEPKPGSSDDLLPSPPVPPRPSQGCPKPNQSAVPPLAFDASSHAALLDTSGLPNESIDQLIERVVAIRAKTTLMDREEQKLKADIREHVRQQETWLIALGVIAGKENSESPTINERLNPINIGTELLRLDILQNTKRKLNDSERATIDCLKNRAKAQDERLKQLNIVIPGSSKLPSPSASFARLLEMIQERRGEKEIMVDMATPKPAKSLT